MSLHDAAVWFAGIAVLGPLSAWIAVHLLIEWLFGHK